MKIDISEKLKEQFDRVEALAKEAEEDDDERFSSRASAMTALTSILKELTKVQQEVYNLERLMKIEKVAIETINKYLTEDQKIEFLQELEDILHA